MTSNDRLNLAVAAYSRGDLPEAQRQGEAVLRAHPKSAAALQLLGIVLCQRGNLPRGIDYLRKALRLSDTPEARLNLARALMESGELDEAERLCRPKPGQPPSRDLQRMLADVLKAKGNQAEAIAVYEQLVAAQPGDAEAWNNLGNAKHGAGDLDGALAALHQARTISPRSPLVHTNLGRVLISLDRYEESCRYLEKAALLAPNDAAPLLELGRVLTSIDHAAAGLRALGDAARLDPRNPRIFLAIGTAFTDLGDLGQAEKSFRIGIQVDPKFAPAYLDLGILLEKANRITELGNLIAQAQAEGLEGGEIDYLRALSLSRSGATGEALELVRSVRTRAVHPAKVAYFRGQLADRLNLVDEAFAAFEDMNRAAAESPLGVGIDRGAYQRGIEGLARQTTNDWFLNWPKVSIEDDRQSPSFLVGFPRSGTTLLDTVLMGHDGTHVLEEVPILEKVAQSAGDLRRVGELEASEIAALRAQYFAELDKIASPAPGKLVIDKNPLSMIRLPLIHRLFPDARIILTLRHPCDVVLSCFMQNFKVTEAMASFLDLTNASLTYDRIFSYWEQCTGIFPLRLHTIRYETMVQDLEGEVRPLLDFLGLPWDETILDHQRTAAERGYIRTPSYAQVTERLYSRASGRWTRYRRHMEHVLPILAPWADRLGYDID